MNSIRSLLLPTNVQLIQVSPVEDRHGSVKSAEGHGAFMIQLLLPFCEGHSQGNQLPRHQHRVHLQKARQTLFNDKRTRAS